MAHIVDLAPEPRGGVAQGRDVGEAVMQPARQIHAEFHRLQQQALPALAEHAAAVVVPTMTVLTPAAAASSTVMSGSRRSALQPGRRSCPRQISGRQNAMPSAVLAASWSGASPMNSRYGVRIVTGRSSVLGGLHQVQRV